MMAWLAGAAAGLCLRSVEGSASVSGHGAGWKCGFWNNNGRARGDWNEGRLERSWIQGILLHGCLETAGLNEDPDDKLLCSGCGCRLHGR